jgi:glyoxylase-like metal-dependent hydrolase (beta-lactamase superfamily II)
MQNRFPLVAAFGVLLVTAFFTADSGAQANSVKKIADGVWFREGDLKVEGHCNNVIIEMKDYLVIVDANFPSGARLAMADARKLSPKPVKYVFVTHHHGDHDYGSAVWTAAGATTLAYKGVAEELQRYEPARWKDTAKSRKDVADLNRQTAEPPTQVFDQSPFVLKDETREIQFHFLGWAHTRGDGFAWLPKERILATGDAAANGPYNYTADANIGNWSKVMAAAEKLGPLHVLPGHGPAGGPEILRGQGKFMDELLKAVGDAARSGKQLKDLVTMREGKPASTAVRLSAAVKNWVGPSMPAQVTDAYNEIAQKKPVGEIPHE